MVVHIIATGYNCADNVKKFVDSVLKQTNDNWLLYLVNDGSTDSTGIEIGKACLKHVEITSAWSYPENMGAAFRRWDVIRNCHPDAIIALAGLDDELLPNCVEEVIKLHKAGKWVTYGNWIDQYGKGLDKNFPLEFPDVVHEKRSYRKEIYRSTAINTFRAFLFHEIPVEDFQINGKWIDSTTESEVMFSCLEMAGRDRIGIIHKPVYLYNKNLPNGTLKRLGADYKYKLYNVIASRPKKPLYEEIMAQKDEKNPLKVQSAKWEKAMQNLRERRSTGVSDNSKTDSIVADYGRHLRAIKKTIGNSVLDVGCGDMSIKRHLHVNHPDVKYTGIDPFPVNDEVVKMQIEKIDVKTFESVHGEHETLICFACLDGVQDLKKAVDNMKKLAKKNIVFLTGIDIEPDQYHTFKITEPLLHELMSGWKVNMSNYLTPKVLLIEYIPG